MASGEWRSGGKRRGIPRFADFARNDGYFYLRIGETQDVSFANGAQSGARRERTQDAGIKPALRDRGVAGRESWGGSDCVMRIGVGHDIACPYEVDVRVLMCDRVRTNFCVWDLRFGLRDLGWGVLGVRGAGCACGWCRSGSCCCAAGGCGGCW